MLLSVDFIENKESIEKNMLKLLDVKQKKVLIVMNASIVLLLAAFIGYIAWIYTYLNNAGVCEFVQGSRQIHVTY